jgi:tRNA(Arg) A34 adenosine deaminase TadA
VKTVLVNKMVKNLIILILGLLVGFLLFQHQLYQLLPAGPVPEQQREATLKQGAKALQSRDVPVGALLIYAGKVIGKGYNQVKKDSCLTAHAEQEALNAAVQQMGYTAFQQLDRDSLIMITTFEPCAMCRGTLLHYGIDRVWFMRAKPVLQWLRYAWHKGQYHLRRQQIPGSAKQDSLFRLHPAYPGS